MWLCYNPTRDEREIQSQAVQDKMILTLQRPLEL